MQMHRAARHPEGRKEAWEPVRQPSMRKGLTAKLRNVKKHNATAARLGKLLSGLNFPGEWDLSQPHVVAKAGKP
jgi:hypothetical protein